MGGVVSSVFGGGDEPDAPDYAGAAKETAAGNLESARATAAANRVNQYTPYGNLEYSPRGTDRFGNELWSVTQSLAPAQQDILNKQSGLSSGLLSTAQQGLNYASNLMSRPGVDTSQLATLKSGVDTSNLPSYGINPSETYSDAIMRRLQPQTEREAAQLESKLANQGIAQGTEAYNTAKQLQQQNINDRLVAAQTGGLTAGLAANQQQFGQNAQQAALSNAARQQGFQETAYNQMQPINVINALRTGSQVQSPNYINPTQQAQTAGADILGATNAGYQNQLSAYNAQQAANSNTLGGLMNLGGTLYKGGFFG